jgi:lipooligosaccharide transport system permease protein
VNPTERPPVPSRVRRVLAVTRRHVYVYTRDFWANSFPTVLEPLMFILAVGWGLAAAVGRMGGTDYLSFIAPAQAMIAAVYTAAFEESYGSYFRLRVDHNYDSMLVTPVGVDEIFWGELLYTGLKGVFYSAVVVGVLACFGTVHSPAALAIPAVGFFTALASGSLGLYAVRFVTNLNQFNFFISGVISPLILFSGTLFPIQALPAVLQIVARWLPLYPMVGMARMLNTGSFTQDWPWLLIYILTVPCAMALLAVRGMRSRLIQ